MKPLKTINGILPLVVFPNGIEHLRIKRMNARNKLVFGVGVNDADYVVSPKIDGKQVRCKIYTTWLDMLRRCYDESYLDRFPSYLECTVCTDWHLFSRFKAWMDEQDYKEKHLDKDVISPGNKVYSPGNCAFIDSRVNLLLTDRLKSRGEFKIGVCKVDSGYQAKVQNDGVHEYLGTFKTEGLAAAAYAKRKYEIILSVAEAQECIRVANGLKRHAKIIEGSI